MMRALVFGFALALAAPVSGAAQIFTDPVQVRQILGLTRANWIEVREFDGKDLVYFTHLASYRCGIAEIRFGINTGTPDLILNLEPCYRDEQPPNAIKGLPYLTYPLGSVQQVVVEVIFPDGPVERAVFDRTGLVQP